MRIAIDISPIGEKSTSAHKVRGVGKYISLLKDNLPEFDKKNSYIFTANPTKDAPRVDLIHYPYFDPFFITLPLYNRIPTVVTVHDIIPIVHQSKFPVGLKGSLKWRLNKVLLKRVSAVITDSVASKDDIHSIVGIAKDKIFSVYLSVDRELRKMEITNETAKSIREKYHLPHDFLLYVGDVTWNKNLPRLTEAIKKVNMPLLMVGKALTETDYDASNPWNHERVKTLKKIQDNPLFIRAGFIPNHDLVVLYNMAKALVMPSFDEGFGLPVLEALTCGCPVVSSSLGSLPEVAGNAAIYVDAYSIESIAQGIYEVLDPTVQSRLRKDGIIQSQKFSLQKCMDETVTVYENVYLNERKH